MIDLFIRGVQVLGLPKSIGEIYGLLFITAEPQPLDALVQRLHISKGSASQGLKFLRNLGAVQQTYVAGDRRDHYVAETALKKLVGGFVKGEVTPHMESGASRLEHLQELASKDRSPDGDFYRTRIAQIKRWRSRGGKLLALVEKFLS